MSSKLCSMIVKYMCLTRPKHVLHDLFCMDMILISQLTSLKNNGLMSLWTLVAVWSRRGDMVASYLTGIITVSYLYGISAVLHELGYGTASMMMCMSSHLVAHMIPASMDANRPFAPWLVETVCSVCSIMNYQRLRTTSLRYIRQEREKTSWMW